MQKPKELKKSYWYFGGLASAGAASFTHPLDLIKVHLQTQQTKKGNMISNTRNIVAVQGVRALYNGISASLLRQLTYSTTRFGFYEVSKSALCTDTQPLSFSEKIGLAAIGGAMGGICGTPADMVNVRMQNDIKLPLESRRNYKHAIDGLVRVYQYEGVPSLFNGASMAVPRAALMTVGQISMYDQIRQMLISSGYFKDDAKTHFTASLCAGAIATTLTQPLDVLKTRVMNAQPGEYRSVFHCVMVTAKNGPLGFFKGYIPAFTRLGPQTVLTFMFLEQLRFRFGYFPPNDALLQNIRPRTN